MTFKENSTGLQHIGLPTNDIKKTLEFYAALGFEVAYQTVNNGEPVAFLRLGDLTFEAYENGRAVGITGAVDHVAINVTDVEAARKLADEMHLNVIEEGQLPFWDNGVKHFTILGPNQEKIEFNQYL